jgi:hypothetical protein
VDIQLTAKSICNKYPDVMAAYKKAKEDGFPYIATKYCMYSTYRYLNILADKRKLELQLKV